MTTEKIFNPDDASLSRAAQVIQKGGLVAFPTETVYGLGGNALDPDAARKIYKAKGRPSDNPLIIHLAYPADAEKYAVTCPVFYRIAELYMPGPITVILPKKDIIPLTVTGGLDTVAVRIPSNPVAHRLIELSGVPIAAPSANISGKPSPTSFSHIEHDLDGRADVLIDGGDCEIGLESTIVKPDGDGLIVLRPGGITPEMLARCCREVRIDRAVTEKFDGKPLAPGMKYRHYAPDAPLTVLKGSDGEVYEFLKDKTGCGILCFDSDTELLARPNAYSLGGRHDSLTNAHRLFSCLRSFEGVDIIYARMPDREGVGLAVFNRLIKASGFTVLDLENGDPSGGKMR